MGEEGRASATFSTQGLDLLERLVEQRPWIPPTVLFMLLLLICFVYG